MAFIVLTPMALMMALASIAFMVFASSTFMALLSLVFMADTSHGSFGLADNREVAEFAKSSACFLPDALLSLLSD
jgi:hypothetical protein